MKTLFSPIGTADPLTQLGDGPMLHIVRHYKPQKVVLFLSPDMAEYQEKDGRYTEAIERLCTMLDMPKPKIELMKSNDKDVYRFDHFIGEFEEALAGLCAQSPDEPVLVNVTSGTPGWQQALVAIGSFGRLPIKLLQVTTPRKGINKRQDREKPNDYDLDTLWEWYEEMCAEDPDSKASRVIEVETPNFADRLLRENVATLVQGYEYEAAYRLAYNAQSISESAKSMIQAAACRLNLDGSLPAKVFAKTALAYKPNDLLGEYLAVMQVRLEQGHWADFVRMLTPAFTHLSREVLRQNGLPEQRYLRMDKGKPTSKLDWSVIVQDDRLTRVLENKQSSRPPLYITNDMLIRLVEEYCQNASAEAKLEALRKVERECRHPLAHDLHASSKETLERYGGLSLEKVMQYLFDLHGNARPHLYASISKAIIEQL